MGAISPARSAPRSEEHTSELQSRVDLVCRLLLEKKKKNPVSSANVFKDKIFTVYTNRHSESSRRSLAVGELLFPSKSRSQSIPFSPFFFNDTATTEIYTLSLHDALPIFSYSAGGTPLECITRGPGGDVVGGDRKSTRLNSSHEWISYAVFCLKKKKK